MVTDFDPLINWCLMMIVMDSELAHLSLQPNDLARIRLFAQFQQIYSW